MAEWVWEARARTGEVRKGVMDADDKEAVNQRLELVRCRRYCCDESCGNSCSFDGRNDQFD